VFRGEYPLSLDSKGRLAVPSRYRERLSESCAGKLGINISLLERCLVA
jgi:MraZ protein